jgi:predicted DNA-binding transcriptional regulator AlpA
MQHERTAVFLRRSDLKEEFSITRHTSYELEANDPTFPKRRILFGQVTGWLRSEIEAWINKLPPVTRKNFIQMRPDAACEARRRGAS